MEAEIFINTSTKVARSSVDGVGTPRVPIKFQRHLKLTVYFFIQGEDPALLDGATTFNVTLKALDSAGGALFAQLIAPTATGADYYEFEWSKISNAALLAAIGDNEDGVNGMLEIGWSLNNKPESVSIEVTIDNNWQRDDDVLPTPTDALEAAFDARAVRFDKAQTLTNNQVVQALTNINLIGIRSIELLSSGYLKITAANGDVLNAGLNTGEPPT